MATPEIAADSQSKLLKSERDAALDTDTKHPGILITELAILPEKTILDEARLGSILGVTTRTVRRMVARHELPPPIPFAGRSTWLAGRVLAHIEAKAEQAARTAERRATATQTVMEGR